MLIPAGFIVIAAAILGWTWWAIGDAAARCGDAPEEVTRLRRRFVWMACLWTALAMLTAASGVLRRVGPGPPPLAYLVGTVVVVGIAFARSTAGDRLARGLPLAALVGTQAFRLPLELLMHRAAVQGVMPLQMSYGGWNFDILTGLTAALLAVWLSFGTVPASVVRAWNVLGLVLLTNIVTIAVLSTPMFAWFGTSPDRLNTFVTYPPYILLPAVMVLAAWAGHLLIFKALSIRAAGLSSRRASAPGPR